MINGDPHRVACRSIRIPWGLVPRGAVPSIACQPPRGRMQMRYRSMLVILGATLSAAGVQAQVSPGQPGGANPPEQTNPGTQAEPGTQGGSGTEAPTGTQTPSASPSPSGTQAEPSARTSTDTRTDSTQASQEANPDTDHVSRCKARYRTYNPRTDMFYARPGVRRRCRL
jgi:hypothetical protein